MSDILTEEFQNTFKEYLGIALLQLYTLDKYLYNVAARLKIMPGEDLPGKLKGVRGYTDGVTIFFTPSWLQEKEQVRLTTLTHEVLHVISKHLVRIRDLNDIDHHRMNVAADLSIAGQQLELKQSPPITNIIQEYKKYLYMDMFEIYELLEPDMGDQDLGHPRIGGMAVASQEEGTENGQEQSGDEVHLPAPSQEEEFSIDQAIQQAAVQAESEGYSTNLSKAASRQINEMNAKKIRWDQYLIQVASRLKSELPTWTRPNRRMMSQVYLPSRTKKEIFEATVAMDVSGSVGQTPLNQMGAIIQDILTRFVDKLHLITFDDKIVDEWDLTRRDKVVSLSLNGYGGTEVNVVTKYLEDKKRNPKVLIIATDGWIPKPKDPGYRVIWLIVNNPGFKSDFGTVLHVNTKELT